jgi:hypothetical protein
MARGLFPLQMGKKRITAPLKAVESLPGRQTAIRAHADAAGDSRNMNFHIRLKRPVLKTSRLLEFCSQKELVLQTGHPVEQWPFVLVKELFDNALDAAEEAGTAPIIKVAVQSAPSPSITVTDNGPGIAAGTVEAMLDFNVRASSRQAHAIPTRGAQGNALKTLVAMAFALDGSEGETVIEACGVRHRIRFCVDRVRQVPKIDHSQEASDVKIGTSVTVRWPQSASQSSIRRRRGFYKSPKTTLGSIRTYPSS